MALLVSDSLILSGLSAGLGILSHLTYFIHGEHHNSAPTLALLCFVIPVLLFVGQLLYTEARPRQAALMTTIACMSYTCALWTSMIIYRVFFHRLHHFPGPFIAKVTKLFHFFLSAQKSDNHIVVDRLHQIYGPFVRTGPCEISIAAPEGPMAILGPNSKCIKAPWYDGGLPLMSLHTARVRADHDKRRKVWEPGFTTKALRNYEKRIIKYTQRLMSQISAFGGKPIDVTAWMGFFGFDIMGDLAFGKSFDMLESGKQHYALKLMLAGQSYLGYIGLIPWLAPIAVRIPGAMRDYEKWVEWSVAQVEARRKMEVPEPDVMSWLLEASKDAQDPREDANWLSGDSRLIIVAGSDTSATTMTNVFYYLAKYPSEYAKLRAELSRLVKPTVNFNVNDVRDAPHLNGCINEALRIRPPVPSAIYRVTPPEGIMVDDQFIPGGVTVSSPMWTLGRLESIYPHAEEFIPERWYSRPELLKTKDAFAPFSLGPYGCIGKQLAYMEMRTVITLLVLNYRISFAPGEDGEKFYEKTVDIFTMALGELKLVFEKIESE